MKNYNYKKKMGVLFLAFLISGCGHNMTYIKENLMFPTVTEAKIDVSVNVGRKKEVALLHTIYFMVLKGDHK